MGDKILTELVTLDKIRMIYLQILDLVSCANNPCTAAEVCNNCAATTFVHYTE